MLFLWLFLLILGLQFLHRRFLSKVLPVCWNPWLAGLLLVLHTPLAVFMALRLTGFATHPVAFSLRSLSRAALYFQIIAVANLLVWALVAAFWAFRRWVREEPKMGPEDPSRRRFLQGGATASLGVLAFTGGAGTRAAQGDPAVTRLDIPLQDLPAGFEGLRIAHLTDLHSGPLVNSSQLRRWRAMAEREHPELLIFTGDFVDSLPEEIEPLLEAFRDFPAPLGRFAILGNHDYFTDPRPIWEALERSGTVCLENRHAILERNGAQLALFGLQDPMARNGRFQGIRFGPGPMPQDVVLALPPKLWRMAMLHRPSNWNLAREAGARFTLAGHTHGGQINLIPGVNSATMLGPYTHGLYRQEGRALFVSRGLGVVGIPLRIGASPELAILTLRCAENPAIRPA
jgi:hypothetical protein